MNTHVARLKKRVEELESQIVEAAKATTTMETNSVLEVALADIECRQPEAWARDYLAYIKAENSNYF